MSRFHPVIIVQGETRKKKYLLRDTNRKIQWDRFNKQIEK